MSTTYFDLLIAFVCLKFLVKRGLILSSSWDKLWITNDKSTYSTLKTFVYTKLSTENQVLTKVKKTLTCKPKLLINIKL